MNLVTLVTDNCDNYEVKRIILTIAPLAGECHIGMETTTKVFFPELIKPWIIIAMCEGIK